MDQVRLGKYILYPTGKIVDANYDAEVKDVTEGYVKLYLNGKYHRYKRAKLIAHHFLNAPIGSITLKFKDGNPNNASVENLEYIPKSPNQKVDASSKIPQFKIQAFDPYNILTLQFNSIHEAVIYLKSISDIEDSDIDMSLKINKQLDTNVMAYGYRWNRI